MMNRSNSDEAAYVPSMMSFVGLEGSNLKQHHLWDCWETNSHNPNTAAAAAAAAAPLPNTTNLLNHAFFAHSTATTTTPPLLLPTFLDCPVQPPPPPPLFPLNSFPFYSAPHVAAEYPVGLVKREDGAVGSSSGRIGLNLGHRTYFSSADAFAIDRLFARSRSMYSLSHHQPPRCQAEGCKADLSGAKHYHRRHKVCEFHSKATVVVAAGLQQRFCQQCSRFHVLAEFDEAKRSCRKRLADHNRRRRKPQLPAATSESSSSKKDHSSKTTEKCKQIQKTNSRDSTTTKFTTTACTGTNTSTSISLEGQQSYQGKGNQLRNVAALSLGGVGPVEKVGMRSATVYQGGQGPFVPVAQGKFSQRQQQQQQQDTNTFSSAASNSSFFHHLNLFSSNEASQQSTEGGGGGSGHCTSQHQSGLLHLGQAMFEVDFL